MAYTIPEYVDTQEQAILAVASAVKGEQVTGGDGSVNTALDILADALAGQDVTVPMTDQGAILALAQYVIGGGGGSATTDVWLWNNTQGSGNDVLPETIGYIKGLTEVDNDYEPVLEPLEFEPVTEQYAGTTIYGVHVKDVPVGAAIVPSFDGGYVADYFSIFYSLQAFPPANVTEFSGTSALKPIEGLVLSGAYTVYLSS